MTANKDKDRAKVTNGNAVIEIIPCGVHPRHAVKVRRNGSRSGCAMCEMAVESLTRIK